MIETIKRLIQYIGASREKKSMIADYLDNKRFMSRYHNGAKKEVGKTVTYDVFVNGKKLASATGNDADAKKEAGHYALMYTNDGKVEVRKKARKSFVTAGHFI